MNKEAEPLNSEGDPNVYFSAERTLLSWVRTGLSMMGFGFVVARFGLFLREVMAMQGDSGPSHNHMTSLLVGVMMVVLGVLVSLGAAFGHVKTIRRLKRNQPLQFSSFSLGTLVAIVMGVIGIATSLFLIMEMAK